ncbi:protein INCA1 isoform X1 [Dipodomys merriami]|uniref:protein INCA1 isoform X1 n=2 Tax=Dipodomys merriami TaxID=94247 RepID=UPI0038559EB5
MTGLWRAPGARGADTSTPRTTFSPATQTSPVMQVQEDGDNLMPFAKCSKVVSRSTPLSLPSQSLKPMAQHYGDVFWENLTQRSNPNWMEEQSIPPKLRGTGCSQPGIYPPEGLLPPEMLCGRKRRRLHLEKIHQRPGGIPARVRAVTYHLEDLKRRQRTINELKKVQWGSCRVAPEPLLLEAEGSRFPGTTENCDLQLKRATTFLQEEGHFVHPDRAQLLWSPWSPLGQESFCASGRLSSFSCSAVTATRNPVHNLTKMEPEE